MNSKHGQCDTAVVSHCEIDTEFRKQESGAFEGEQGFYAKCLSSVGLDATAVIWLVGPVLEVDLPSVVTALYNAHHSRTVAYIEGLTK